MKDCLEEHRDEAEFSSECKEEFEKMMEARAADYRLDSSLREKCADDIEDLCGFQKVHALIFPLLIMFFKNQTSFCQAEHRKLCVLNC